MRKYLRAIARANMERAGLSHVNRRPKIGKDRRSYFALHWREWVHPEKSKKRRKRRETD